MQTWIVAAGLTLVAAAAAAQDTVVVRADNAPVWGEHPRLVEELRIGVIEGPDEYIFGSVDAVTVRDDGSIFVYDRQVPVIRQFGPDGRYVRDIGREGAGPGEYRQVGGMYILPDGGLVTFDGRNARISIYDANGSFVDSRRFDAVPSGSHAFTVDAAGNFYLLTADVRSIRAGSGPPRHYVRLSNGDAGVDTIPVPPSETEGAQFILSLREGGRVPFVDGRFSTLGNRGYLVVGHNRTYALDLHIAKSQVRRITREAESVPVKAEERAQWEALQQWSNDMLRERGGQPRDYPTLPRTKPFFRGLSVDAEGRIWVDRYVEATKREVDSGETGDNRPPFEWREPPTFDVFHPDGHFLGTIVLPEDTRVYYRRGMHLWGVTFGEQGEAYVVRFRIVPGRP